MPFHFSSRYHSDVDVNFILHRYPLQLHMSGCSANCNIAKIRDETAGKLRDQGVTFAKYLNGKSEKMVTSEW